MTLKEYLKNRKKEIALLWFDSYGALKCEYYDKSELKNIEEEFLNMEVEDTNEEDNEVWLR